MIQYAVTAVMITTGRVYWMPAFAGMTITNINALHIRDSKGPALLTQANAARW
jgi:hypothetical protein